MNHTTKLLTFLVFGTLLFLSSTGKVEIPNVESPGDVISYPMDTVVIEYTGRIKEIIDQKCYDCHSEKGDDEEAKEELLWDELPKLSPMDQVYALDAIAESVEDGDMPPSKYVLWRPHKRISDEEAKLLIDWAKNLSDKLYKSID